MAMSDKEFLEGEKECPVYGAECDIEFCKGCAIGTDRTAECPFRKSDYEEGANNGK